MKKTVLLLVLLFSLTSIAQLTKIEFEKPKLSTKVGPMGAFWIGADIFENHVDIRFQDANFTKIEVYKNFSLILKDFEDLYLLLSKEDNKEEDFYNLKTLDGKQLYVKFAKSFGYLYPIIMLTDSGVDSKWPNLTKSQIRKLFNKNN